MLLIMLSAIIFCLIACSDDSSNNNNNNQTVDSNVVLRVDSVVLNTSNSLFVQQTFNFSKKLRNVKFQYWGESNIPAANGPYIKLVFKSDSGDSVTVIQSGSDIDSIPRFISGISSFTLGDSCQTVKAQLSVNDSISPPITPDKYIKMKNLKIYYY